MGQSVDQQPQEDARTRVFLSYSRKDSELVAKVATGLMDAGFLADYDQAAHDPLNVSAGISAEDEWWKRLQEMIASADVMVFLVSPDSAASTVCDEEIAYARALGKRIIAVLARPVDFAKAPPRLAALNVRINFSETGPGFDAALAALVSALQTNVGWHREGRKYFARVQEWDTRGRPRSLLLREGAVEEAERWALARPRNEPEPGELFLAWIAASREQIKRDAARRAFWRRVTAVFVLTTLIATLAGAWFVVNGQRNLGRSESLMLARTSEQLFAKGDYMRALHLAILASRDSFLSPQTDEARAVFAQSAQALQHMVSFEQTASATSGENVVLDVFVSPDGSRVASKDAAGRIYLWDTETGSAIGAPMGGSDADAIRRVEYSADGQRLLTEFNDGVQVWETSTGNSVGERIILPDVQPGNYLVGSAISPDGAQVVTLHSDGGARLWKIGSPPAEALRINTGWAFEAKFAADGRGLLLTEAEGVYLLDPATGARRAGPFLPGAGTVAGALLSPDGQWLAVKRSEPGFDYWNIADGRVMAASPVAARVRDVRFIPGAQRFLTWSEDDTVQIHDMMTGAPVGEAIRVEIWPDRVSVSEKEGLLLTSTFLGGPKVWSLETGMQLALDMSPGQTYNGEYLLPGRGAFIAWSQGLTQFNILTDMTASQMLEAEADGLIPISTAGVPFDTPDFIDIVAVSPDGNFVATVESILGTTDGRAYILDAGTGNRLGGALPHNNFAVPPVFLPDGNRVLTISDNRVSIWKLATWRAMGVDPAAPKNDYGAMLSPDGSRLFTWTQSGLAALWDTSARKEIGSGLVVGEQGFWGAVFDRSLPQMALWYEGAVQIIDTQTGEGSEALMEHETQLMAADFAAGGRRLLTLDDQTTAHLWDTQAFSRLGAARSHTGAGAPPVSEAAGRWVVWSGTAAQLVDLETGADAGKPLQHSPPTDEEGSLANSEILGAAFSPDGRRLVTWSTRELRVWDAATGEPSGIMVVPSGDIWEAVLSADGATVLVAEGVFVRQYDTATGAPTGVEMRHGSQEVNRILLSSDGRYAATANDEWTVRLWNAKTGAPIGNPLQAGMSDIRLSFSPDGTRLLVWEPGGGRWIMDSATGAPLAYVQVRDPTDEIAWLDDGRTLVTASYSGEVRSWDMDYVMRARVSAVDVADVCAEKLQGVGTVRKLDSVTTFAAPILRGREGEDVCAPPVVPWWERAAGVVFGWAFR